MLKVLFAPTIIPILALMVWCTTIHAEPAEDHWSPDTDIKTWQEIKHARKLIEADKFDDALALLNRLVADLPENAELHNLLGYAYRKTEDFDRSLKAYQLALELNPNHKGALEYQGELFLVLNLPGKAAENLAALKRLCPGGCEELADLEKEMSNVASD